MNTESLLAAIETLYPGKVFLGVQELSSLLACDVGVIQNWSKRADPRRDPDSSGDVLKFFTDSSSCKNGNAPTNFSI